MKQKQFTIQHITLSKTTSKTFSAGIYYEILLMIKGGCQFELENNRVSCSTESVVFLKPHETISMHFTFHKIPLELFRIHIHPDYLEVLSDDTCSLTEAFSSIPLSKGMLHLDTRNATLLKNVAKTALALSNSTEELGYALYEKNMLSIFVILFLRSCIASDHVHLSHQRKNLVMDDIFRYIREHLTEDLSLEVLEQQFFVSRYHLCREFKKLTGQTIHSYIIKSRLDLCKKYIEAGKPIQEVYALGGFGSYNHFFRAFKKEYGMTPKKYYESLKNENTISM